MTYISSPINPTIKYYNSLERAKVRARDNVFLIEGDVLVRESLYAGVQFVSAIVDRSRKESVQDLVECLEQMGVPIYCTDDKIMAKASTMTTPQAILAVGRTPKQAIDIEPNGRYLVCENLQNPGNAGAILRSAAAFGVDGVIFIGSCDLYSSKVLRGSMGAVYRVPVFVAQSVDEAYRLLSERNITSYAAVVGEQAIPIRSVDLSSSCAVWIGNEGNGLTNYAIDICKNKVYIPMRQDTESLNASVAASIIMWEMLK